MLYACVVHDAVHSNRSYQDPFDSCPWDPQAEEYCLSVGQIVSSGINPELMECKLIAHPT